MSGLSLRTVQRLEAGHRVSYASLRALAATFHSLERELYAVRDTKEDSIEIPRFVRLVSDRRFGGRGLSRRDMLVVEAFCLVCAGIALAVALSAPAYAQPYVVALLSACPLFGAYLTALTIRMMDRYKLWPGAENAPAERPRTWRTILLEYTYMLGLGALSIAAILWSMG